MLTEKVANQAVGVISEKSRVTCPFMSPMKKATRCTTHYCGVIFPELSEDKPNGWYMICPCHGYGKVYVVEKFWQAMSKAWGLSNYSL